MADTEPLQLPDVDEGNGSYVNDLPPPYEIVVLQSQLTFAELAQHQSCVSAAPRDHATISSSSQSPSSGLATTQFFIFSPIVSGANAIQPASASVSFNAEAALAVCVCLLVNPLFGLIALSLAGSWPVGVEQGHAHKLANNEPDKIHLARRYARTSSCLSLVGMVVTIVFVLPIALVIGLSAATEPGAAAAAAAAAATTTTTTTVRSNTLQTIAVESCTGFNFDGICYECSYFKGSCFTDSCCQSSEIYVDSYCYSRVNCTHSTRASSTGSASATDVKTRTVVLA